MRLAEYFAPPRAFARLCLVAIIAGGAVGCSPIPFEPRDGSGAAAEDDLILAEVAGRVITARELERRVLDRFYGPRALLGLVREALFLEEARQLGVQVTETELERHVEEELVAVLGSTEAERRESIERLRFQGLEVDDIRRELRQEWRSILLIQEVVQAHRSVTENEIRARYEASWNTDRRLVRHIAFPLRGDADDPAVVEQVQNRANAVREAILSGASFEESARTFSANPETAAHGGEIGWLGREDLGNGELAQFIFELPVGRVGPLYAEGSYGFQLFEVLDERAAKPYEEVREQLEQELRTAPPTDAEIFRIEGELRRRIPVRVRSEIPPPPGA